MAKRRLRQWRHALCEGKRLAGLTNEDIGELMDLSASSVGMKLAGKRPISLIEFDDLARILGISIHVAVTSRRRG